MELPRFSKTATLLGVIDLRTDAAAVRFCQMPDPACLGGLLISTEIIDVVRRTAPVKVSPVVADPVTPALPAPVLPPKTARLMFSALKVNLAPRSRNVRLYLVRPPDTPEQASTAKP